MVERAEMLSWLVLGSQMAEAVKLLLVGTLVGSEMGIEIWLGAVEWMFEFEAGVVAELGLEGAQGFGWDWPRKGAKSEMAAAGWVSPP